MKKTRVMDERTEKKDDEMKTYQVVRQNYMMMIYIIKQNVTRYLHNILHLKYPSPFINEF